MQPFFGRAIVLLLSILLGDLLPVAIRHSPPRHSLSFSSGLSSLFLPFLFLPLFVYIYSLKAFGIFCYQKNPKKFFFLSSLDTSTSSSSFFSGYLKCFISLGILKYPCGIITHLDLGCSDMQGYYNIEVFQGLSWAWTRMDLAGEGGKGAMSDHYSGEVGTHPFFSSQMCCEG